METLKPCPFCGGEAHTIEPARYGKRWGVRCECGAFMGFKHTEAEAIKAWNTRAERTCYNKKDDYRHYFKGYYFVCSECGWSIANSGNAGLEVACEMIRICPSCGAKVAG